ncbi:MAG TPA: O-antigen ligase family protein, partial [Gammaproteobacteria bacterium]|nr:O-antigen ligase family protein [Gammaproteobacteria bacterium]
MPAWLATALTFAFVIGLYVWDGRRNSGFSKALWLPVLWIIPTASRFPTQWLMLGRPEATQNVTDGSTLDAIYFLLLIVSGGIVLVRRRILTAELIRSNFWLFSMLVFGFVSILWSDFEFIAFKRWIKTLGHPIMALIILTDVSPVGAFRVVMKRCAFFLLPTSVLFIKYLPEYGRYFNPFGAGMYRGAMLTKNELGIVTVLFGLFFVWSFLSRARISDARERRDETVLSGIFVLISLYLLRYADSAAALVVFTAGTAIMIGFGMRMISRRYFGTYLVVAVAMVAIAQLTFGIYEQLLTMLGRDITLTDRTMIWTDVIELQTRPLIGMGFESFWLGARIEAMWDKWWWRPNQAHNGYIETYLNLGPIGVALLFLVIVSAFRRIAADLETDFEFARFRMALLFSILAYNVTEAMFKGVAITWLMFHIVVIAFPRSQTHTQQAEPSSGRSKSVRAYGRNLPGASPGPTADSGAQNE